MSAPSPPSADGSAPNGLISFLLQPESRAADLYPETWANPLGDAGVDLRFPEDTVFPEGETTVIRFGVRAACFINGKPTGFWLAARGSFGKTPQVLMLRNHMGTFDRGYRGEVMARVHNFGPGVYQARRGESLFQLV